MYTAYEFNMQILQKVHETRIFKMCYKHFLKSLSFFIVHIFYKLLFLSGRHNDEHWTNMKSEQEIKERKKMCTAVGGTYCSLSLGLHCSLEQELGLRFRRSDRGQRHPSDSQTL